MEAKTNKSIVLDYLINADTSPFWAIKHLTMAVAAEDTMFSNLVPPTVKKAYVSLTKAQEADVLIALGGYIKNQEELLK